MSRGGAIRPPSEPADRFPDGVGLIDLGAMTAPGQAAIVLAEHLAVGKSSAR